jgi:hypothetical protein
VKICVNFKLGWSYTRFRHIKHPSDLTCQLPASELAISIDHRSENYVHFFLDFSKSQRWTEEFLYLPFITQIYARNKHPLLEFILRPLNGWEMESTISAVWSFIFENCLIFDFIYQ